MTTNNTMTTQEAAAYLGMAVSQFRRAVERGELPKPVIRCRPQRWSRWQLDQVLEGHPVEAPSSPETDPVMEAIRCAFP